MYIVTTSQMQAAEKAADASGLPYAQMMENAGRAVAQAIDAHFDVIGVQVLVLVGPGNNGGDGLVAARYLSQMGASVTVYVWKRHVVDDKNWVLLESTGLVKVWGSEDTDQVRLRQLLQEAGIIVDALLGTGVTRPIEGSLAELLDQAKAIVAARRVPPDGPLVDPTLPLTDNEFGPAVVAVDVPSGLNSDTGTVDPHTLPADLTVTLVAIPLGLLIGYGLCAYLAFRFDTDLYRIPLQLDLNVYAFAALVVILSSIISGMMIWRNLGHLDMVAVLKTKE